MTDEEWMASALELALAAERQGEVPIGAALIKGDNCLGEGWNNPIATKDPSAHAEITALRQAGLSLDNYRLNGATLYVTLEPCIMCIGAIMHARVERLVFGAYDPARGAVLSAFKLDEAKCFNHKIEWQGGVLAAECGAILQDFFAKKRRLQKTKSALAAKIG